METINIFAKGPVVSQLILRINENKTKACKYLALIKPPSYSYFKPICLKEIAEQEENKNILISDQYTGPRHYYWPKCPPNCRLFKKDRRIEKRLLESGDLKQRKFKFPIQITFPITPSPKTWIETIIIFVFGMFACYLLQIFLPIETIGVFLKKTITSIFHLL